MATLRLDDTAPDFEQLSSEGSIRFHQWLGDSWGVLHSHHAAAQQVSHLSGAHKHMPFASLPRAARPPHTGSAPSQGA